VKSFGVVPLTWTVLPTFTLAPVVTNVATSAVTFVPYGIDTEIVFAPSLIVPVAAGLVKENAVIAFAVFEATVTVTIYVTVELSVAVTMYDTGLVKSFGVVPLTWTVLPTFTLAPDVANVATSAIMFVPYGIDTEIVFALSLIVPVTAGLLNEKAVMALADVGDGITIPLTPPPPHPSSITTSNRAVIKNLNSTFIFELSFFRDFFIIFSHETIKSCGLLISDRGAAMRDLLDS
jgi:hypothetical protein